MKVLPFKKRVYQCDPKHLSSSLGLIYNVKSRIQPLDIFPEEHHGLKNLLMSIGKVKLFKSME